MNVSMRMVSARADQITTKAGRELLDKFYDAEEAQQDWEDLGDAFRREEFDLGCDQVVTAILAIEAEMAAKPGMSPDPEPAESD